MNSRFQFPLVSLLALFATACAKPGDAPGDALGRADETSGATNAPNILWVVWDTVRPDRMSLYGHERQTTPRLDEWARGARVFDDCLSTAPITVSSHAAMFTGLLPSESGASNAHQWLDEGFDTLAEKLNAAGYRTFAWAANPHLSREENFTQGFETVEHPWDPAVSSEARAIVAQKVQGDRSNEIEKRLRKAEVDGWTLKAAGELAEQALDQWLERTAGDRPYFAFINYMEAHRPLIPPRRLRERMMAPEEVDRSYAVDVSWVPMWAFSFGLSEIAAPDLELIGRVYDAALLELDGLFDSLLARLREAGRLENTVIILTSDHGEHLGDHHMLDHQFSVFDSLLAVPLIVHYPPRFRAGRESRPVSNHDLFPTLLELAGIEGGLPPGSDARSLLEPALERARIAEFTAPFTKPFRALKKAYPDWDGAPWEQSLRALTSGEHKLIWGSAGRRELYRIGREETNLAEQQPELLQTLERDLHRWVKTLRSFDPDEIPDASEEHQNRLQELGYSGSDEENEE